MPICVPPPMTSAPVSCPNCGYGWKPFGDRRGCSTARRATRRCFAKANALAPIGNPWRDARDADGWSALGDTPSCFDGGRYRRVAGPYPLRLRSRLLGTRCGAEDAQGEGIWLSIARGGTWVGATAPRWPTARGSVSGRPKRGAPLAPSQVRSRGKSTPSPRWIEATATAFRGELPDTDRPWGGERHRFVNPAAEDGTASVRRGLGWRRRPGFSATWLDPFEIRVERQTG